MNKMKATNVLIDSWLLLQLISHKEQYIRDILQ